MQTQRVIFRQWHNGDVIALFPDQPDGPYIGSYEHVGQHGNAWGQHVVSVTTPATRDAYRPLLAELESIGYELRVIRRLPRHTT